MSAASQGPQQLGNRVVQSRVHRERDQFVASIPEGDVLRLASSYHDGDPCFFFQPPTRGSYNICYFVQFESAGTTSDSLGCEEPGSRTSAEDRWVVRVPLPPCWAVGVRNKLESEVATMQLIAEKTAIPVPKIHAYVLGSGPGILSTFLILEYIEGEKLSYNRVQHLSAAERSHFYRSLADIYIELRRLEFPSIGCLERHPDGCFEVCKRTKSIDLNMQELEGLGPSKIQDIYYGSNNTLTSATTYTTMLLHIAENAFLKGQNSVVDPDMGPDSLYHLRMFHEYAEGWIDESLDRGPFVLVHGDLEPFNLLVDENMHVVAVLDWEWSQVVPRQFFRPPLWLKYSKMAVTFKPGYDSYLAHLDNLLSTIRVREREKYGNELLADEWERAKMDGGFLVSSALENWTEMDWVAFRYINQKRHNGRGDLAARIQAFIDQDPSHVDIVARKIRDGIAYNAEMERLALARQVSPDDREKPVALLHRVLQHFYILPLWHRTTLTTFSKTAMGLAVILIGGTYMTRGALRQARP